MANPGSGLARFTARLGVFAVLLVLVGPLLAHFELVAPMAGFIAFGLGGLLALIATVSGLITLLRGGAGPLLWRGLVPSLVVLAIFFIQASRSGNVPRINDITTDTDTPPQFVAARTQPANVGRDLRYPGDTFAEQQRAGYPDLAPLRLDLSPDEAFDRVRTAARNMPGWEITREDADARAIEGFDTSWLFRFKDDFVIEVRAQNGGSVVHMRSKSRDGRGDVGANAARIKAFLQTVSR
jgi:uncharacterized protein (DUF1499 family)